MTFADVAVGVLVEHPAHGLGEVVAVADGSGWLDFWRDPDTNPTRARKPFRGPAGFSVEFPSDPLPARFFYPPTAAAGFTFAGY